VKEHVADLNDLSHVASPPLSLRGVSSINGAEERLAMIDRLIEFSLKNKFIVVTLWIGIAAWGLWAMLHAPIDAIPDLSDNQVIVFTDWQGRSPQEVEDQITYPLTTNLQGLPV
jgi:AcrB/AcrD/AcrF family